MTDPVTTPDPTLVALVAEALHAYADGDGCDHRPDYDRADHEAEAAAILAHPPLRAALEDTERLRAALRYQAARLCLTFRGDLSPATCETHWSEWPKGAHSCEWRQEAARLTEGTRP